jgi:hypothetical protein
MKANPFDLFVTLHQKAWRQQPAQGVKTASSFAI